MKNDSVCICVSININYLNKEIQHIFPSNYFAKMYRLLYLRGGSKSVNLYFKKGSTILFFDKSTKSTRPYRASFKTVEAGAANEVTFVEQS